MSQSTKIRIGLAPPCQAALGAFLGHIIRISGPKDAGEAAWLVPSQAAAKQARREILASETPAWLDPGIRTLRQAADAVLSRHSFVARPLTRVQQHWLVRELLDSAHRQGSLKHFDTSLNVDRLTEIVCRTFADFAVRLGGDKPSSLTPLSDDPAERELIVLYSAYQKTLQSHRLLDNEGRILAATRSLAEGKAEPFANCRQLVLTGFREFRLLEERFVAALAAHLETTHLLLPWPANLHPPRIERSTSSKSKNENDDDSALASPWTPVRRTIASLANHFDDINQSLVMPETFDGDSELVRGWLFRDPRLAPRSSSIASQRYRLVAAPSAYEEMQIVAAEVKQLIASGTTPEQIVLSTRRTSDVAARAKQAFAEAGVPLFVEQPTPLRESPLYRIWLLLLRLSIGDWRWDDLLATVTSPSLSLFDGQTKAVGVNRLRATGFAGPRAAVEWILRELMLPAGREECQQQHMALAADQLSTEGDSLTLERSRSPRSRRLHTAASLAATQLGKLDQATESLRRTATPLEWFDRLRRVASNLAYRASPRLTAAALDEAALPALEEAFASLERLASWRGESSPTLSPEEVETLLTNWATSVTLDTPAGDEGRVRLLSPENARWQQPSYLFLIGMAEQSFPAPPTVSLVGQPTRSLDSHTCNEMLLFYELIHTASQQVTFSYPALDAAGQSLSPSSFVSEVERLLGPSSLRDESPTEKPSSIITNRAALRRESVRKLNEGEATMLGRLGSRPLMAGLRVSLDRQSGDSFGAAEGILHPPAVQQQLTANFDGEYLWSPTQLETYAECPFKFFARHVLGVEPVEEVALEDDYRRRGTLLHQAMVHLHSRLSEADALLSAVENLSENEFAQAFHESIQSALKSIVRPPHEAAIADVEAMQANDWGEAYRQQLASYARSTEGLEGGIRPAYYEARFGPPRDNEPTIAPSKPEPFELDVGDEVVKLTGQVDRIDVGQIDGQTVFNVVDYKTSRKVSAKLSDLRDGRQLQLYLYAVATQEHLLSDQDATPWRLGYWALRDGGFKMPKDRRNALLPTENSTEGLATTEQWHEYGQTVRARIAQIVQSVRRGEFPMFNSDEHCGRTCEFRTVCRVGQTRSLGKLPPGQLIDASR